MFRRLRSLRLFQYMFGKIIQLYRTEGNATYPYRQKELLQMQTSVNQHT